MKRRRSSSSSELQIWTPEKKPEPSRTMDLPILPSSRDSSFTLPDDWVVEKRKRTTGMFRGDIDKYYHEPGTGRMLRFLVSVRRYLTEPGRYEITKKGDIKPKIQQTNIMPLSISLPGVSYKSKSRVMPSSLKPPSLIKSLSCKSADNKILACWKTYIPKHQINIDRSKPLKLPDGWFIKRITRRSGDSMGRVDKYYCERATGRVFRSKLDVRRYLADNYMEENTTLSELFKPAGLTKICRLEDKDADEESALAIVPLSSNKDYYSSISDDMPIKDLVRKSDGMPLKVCVRKSNDVVLKDLVRKPNVEPLKDLVEESDDMPLKDLVRKSSVARKTSKKNVLSCRAKTNSSVHVSSPPMKIKWVLSGRGGDAWTPFISDTIVAESMKQDWTQMFIDIISQKHPEA